MNVAYNHNWDGNFTVTREHADGDPTEATTSSASPCRTIRGCRTSGQQRCGFYDIKPTLFGQGTLRVTNAKEFVGKNGNTKLPQRYWDGVWFGMNGRLPHSVSGRRRHRHRQDRSTITASPWTSRTSPRHQRDRRRRTTWNGCNSTGAGACHVVTSWMDNLDFRFNGSVPIKGGFNGSFIFRNTPGATQNAAFTVRTAANVTFKNGRAVDHADCGPQVINLITPNSLFGDRFNQLDLSINKSLQHRLGQAASGVRPLQRAEQQLDPERHDHLRHDLAASDDVPRPAPGARDDRDQF